MDSENGTPELVQPLQIIADQLAILWVYAQRPIVQRQLLALALVVLLMALAHVLVRRRIKDGREELAGLSERRRLLGAASKLISPLLGLLLLGLSIFLFDSLAYPAGMLRSVQEVFVLFFIYRLVQAALFYRLGAEALPYQRWILLPGFLIAALWLLLPSFVSLQAVAGINVLPLEEFSITVGQIISALLLLYAFGIVAWLVELGMHRAFAERLRDEHGMLDTITKVIRYSIVALGVLVALSELDISLTALAVVGGGLSVGIGFGLQKIVSNLISGIVLLFEQSLRPGDVIEVGGQLGVVRKLSVRATTVRTLDNVDLIVPNETFFTDQVTSYSANDRTVRLRLPIGVSYSSDLEYVREVTLATAKQHPRVLPGPPPGLLVTGFGDSSVNLQLLIWIDQPQLIPQIKSEVYRRVFAAYREAGIEIPFPQRDLHLRSGWPERRAAAEKGGEEQEG